MNTVELYQTSDSKTFADENKALEHQINILGELLDDLLPYDKRGNITRSDRQNLLIEQLKDKMLFNKLNVLSNVVNYAFDNGITCNDVNNHACKWSD